MERKEIKLNYARTALEPHMSAETIDYHFGKHYKAYLDNYNKLIEGHSEYKNNALEEVILHADGPLFNNGAQVVNHELFFTQLTPNAKDTPSGVLLDAINYHFQSFDEFKTLIKEKSLSLFGSGWVWLAVDNKNLVLLSGSNAYNPMIEGMTPILAIDVWEHAYYIDYRNARAEFIDKLWNVIDWNIVEKRYVAAIEK